MKEERIINQTKSLTKSANDQALQHVFNILSDIRNQLLLVKASLSQGQDVIRDNVDSETTKTSDDQNFPLQISDAYLTEMCTDLQASLSYIYDAIKERNG